MAMKVNPDSIVYVRDLAIGDGTPKIIIPLVGKTDAELTAQARRVRKEPGVDAVEWRVDFYEYAKDKERVLGTLGSINEALARSPCYSPSAPRRRAVCCPSPSGSISP